MVQRQSLASSFHTRGPETRKAWLLTVVSLTAGRIPQDGWCLQNEEYVDLADQQHE